MSFTETTRKALLQKFQETHQPGFLFGARNKAVFSALIINSYQRTDAERELLDAVQEEQIKARLKPGTFMRKNYSKVVEFCAGGKDKAKSLYEYFDKLNQFSYSSGWARRTVRSQTYYDPMPKILRVLKTAYELQIFNCSLAKYLLNDMSEEMLDLKNNSKTEISKAGLEDLIAASLDSGDREVKKALTTIINSESNTTWLDVSMMRGIFKSNDVDLHKLMGQYLLAARLQEGVRQAVCENMDCGTVSSFKEIFRVIDENDLLRFSSVRRAVASFIGILDSEHLVRSSNKTFRLMRQCVDDRDAAYPLLDSNDAMSVFVGLWGLAFYEVQDAIREMERMIRTGTAQQRRVVAFFNQNLFDRELQQKFSNKLMELPDLNIELAAGIFPTYMANCTREAMDACGKMVFGLPGKEKRGVDLKKWFPDQETAQEHYIILNNLLGTMIQKKYLFSPWVFPWCFLDITRSEVLLRMCLIANGLKDEVLMDQLAGKLTELDGANTQHRACGVLLLLSEPNTPRRREILVAALGDKSTQARKEAFEIAKDISFTPDEYDGMCELLRFKTADLRNNIITVLKKQDEAGLKRTLEKLLTDKREELRLAGLDILVGIARDETSNTDEVLDYGMKMVKGFEKVSEREQILVDQLLGTVHNTTADSTDEVPALYTEDDTIEIPQITCNAGDYPLFSVTKQELESLFKKLDDLIDEHRFDEFRTCAGEKTMLGGNDSLPYLKYGGTAEERTPLMGLWKEFYEEEIKSPEILKAMFVAVLKPTPFSSETQPYSKYLRDLMEKIHGTAVVYFDPSGYKYGRSGRHVRGHCKPGGDFFYDILQPLCEVCCEKNELWQMGEKVLAYLCSQVPKEKCFGTVRQERNTIPIRKIEETVTPMSGPMVFEPCRTFMGGWNSRDTFGKRFELLLVAESLFLKDTEEDDRRFRDRSRFLSSIDYAAAAYYGFINERQMNSRILAWGDVSDNLRLMFTLYEAEKRPYTYNPIKRLGVDDPVFEQFVRESADKIADGLLRVECKRGDTPTEYSPYISKIKHVYGTNHLVQLLLAMGKDKLERVDSFGFACSESRKSCLSHLIAVCYPYPEDTVDTLREALKGTSITEKRLIEVAMYAPQWIDFIEELLDFRGLKLGCYYFMAHMNDPYDKDARKDAIIARFTPLEKSELSNGAFDIEWFEEAHQTLGEKRFQMLYDAAKYISDGSKHSRARKYADATLGKVKTADLEAEISAKRNKDLLMSYPLVPLAGKGDLLHRYEFILQFRKESQSFGAMRRSSEGTACDMALRNLATRAGFRDVTRLTLAMENELVESLKGYFQWQPLGTEDASACVQVSDAGKPDVYVKKGDKILASIPAAVKKHPYVLELKEANKKFRAQYSRTVKMLELAMEEREPYSIQELVDLTKNPVIRPVLENLVFIHDESGNTGLIGAATGLALVDVNGVVETIPADSILRVAHPYDLYRLGVWAGWQRVFFQRQKEAGCKQPFRQVFRELYVKLDEELDQKYSRLFAGHQIQPMKTAACLKGRRWIADHETGLGKVFYKDGIVATIYALADWFSPSDIEAPTLEWVTFTNRKTFEEISIRDVPDIVYSEVMRDVDLAVSVAHAGGVDPETSHSTIEMRKVIAECNIDLFGLKNVRIEGNHAVISGTRGEYTVHLGSGVIHMIGLHQLNVLPVHSQHRGRVFLPFLDEDPKTAEIISKILLFAEDKKIKDPYILDQMV